MGGEAGATRLAGTAAQTMGDKMAGLAVDPKKVEAIAAANKAKEFQAGLKKLGDTFKEVNTQVAFANVNIHAFASYIGHLPGKFVASMTLAVDALAHVAQPFVNLVARNNPAVARQWELALNDAYGVLGRMLIPVVISFTRQVLNLGNIIAGLEPVFQPAIKSMATMVDVTGNALAAVIKDNTYLFTNLAAALKVTADSVSASILVFKTFYQLAGFQYLKMISGGSAFNKDATSMGAGIRSARQLSGGEDIQNEVIKNALMMGAAGGETKEDKQNNILAELSRVIGALVKWLEDHDILQGSKAGTAGKLGMGELFAESMFPLANALYALLRTRSSW